jgi:hypothetical protein
MLISLLVAVTAPGACPAAGCAPNPPPLGACAGFGGKGCDTFGHFYPNVAIFYGPDPLTLINVPYNHAWTTPFGGWTLYPGQMGSGYAAHSDYSHINWLTTPERTAGMVRGRLAQLGIPAVPPEPLFLGKNPSVTDNIQLPPPRPKTKEPPPADEPDK